MEFTERQYGTNCMQVIKLSNVKEIKDDTDNVSELWRRIQINGQVNTYTPGTYTCSYYVVDSAGNMSNTAELTVIVQ